MGDWMLKQNSKNSRLKKFFSSLLVVVVELGLMVAATAAFITAFDYVDTKHVENTVPRSSANSQVPSQASQNSENPAGAPASAPVSSALPQPLRDWKLTLVNYDNKMPDKFQNVIVHAYNVDLDSRIVEPYRQMHDAAQKDGISIWLSSGYRSPEKQQMLFEQEIQNYVKTGLDYVEALAKAETSVARADYSEHNTGLAVDLNGVLENFGGTPASNWLQKHAPDYGFILRYPADKQDITKIKYEPWHYRYVGIENAKKMNELHLCLEEYVDYLKKNQTTGD